MNIKLFKEIIKDKLSNHFIKLLDKRMMANTHFPALARIIITPSLYIVELIGTKKPSKNYTIETLPPENVKSATDYFTPGFPVLLPISGVTINCRYAGLINIALALEYDKKIFYDKLRMSAPHTEIRSSTGNANVPIVVGSNTDIAFLSNVSIIRTVDQFLFFRHITSALIFQKNHTKKSLLDGLDWILNAMPNSGTSNIHDRTEIISKQLHSFADQFIKERMIDKFISEHASIFSQALGRVKAYPQIKLEWQDKTVENLNTSIPDYMLERADGYFDILDLKQSLRKGSLTVNKAARPRYKSDVSDLIAQLGTYEEYFSYENNRIWAKNKYGIKTNNINVFGIIGNYNSSNKAVLERLKIRNPNFYLIDYNSLANLIRANC